MSTHFKLIEFRRNSESKSSIKSGLFSFFVPGINSGIYSPASLSIVVNIRQKKAGWWRLRDQHSQADITLSKKEFDELFEEMKKIKELRDRGNL